MSIEITYSIIIPHKNIPELLQRCLDSIPRRDDIQIIVVDDNSDADKVDFNQFPGLNDPHVEIVLTKEGKGAGYARNTGLLKAVGKWLLFADADDYFAEGFLNYLDKYKDSEYDLVYFGIYGIVGETKKESTFTQKYNNLLLEAIVDKNYDKFKYSIWVPWGKMLRNSLIKENNITFDEIIAANDIMFSIKCAFYAKNNFFDADKIYTQETRTGSLVTLRNAKANFARFYARIRTDAFLVEIEQQNYKRGVIQLLWQVTKSCNIKYFCKAMLLIRKYKVNLFAELFEKIKSRRRKNAAR